MKALLIGLSLLASSISFADTTISGLVTKGPGEYGQFQIQEKDSGRLFEVDVNIRPGPVCGQAIKFANTMNEAVGHEAVLTGVLGTEGDVFMANSEGIQILGN